MDKDFRDRFELLYRMLSPYHLWVLVFLELAQVCLPPSPLAGGWINLLDWMQMIKGGKGIELRFVAIRYQPLASV